MGECVGLTGGTGPQRSVGVGRLASLRGDGLVHTSALTPAGVLPARKHADGRGRTLHVAATGG